MVSPDHRSSDHPPYDNDPISFVKMLFKGWKSLGPGNLWFWIVPLMVVSMVAGIVRSVLM
ncbi:hypothetical protein FHW77_002375 [Agrobacterium sp. RC10-4-1]|nr:hypothetical protein [Agrobacterium sp. RC10-4-1]